MTAYHDEDLTQVDMDLEGKFATWHCLQCPCGKFTQQSCGQDGEISLTDCPRSGRHAFVYYNPTTGERYQKNVLHHDMRYPTTCEIIAVSTYLRLYLSLRDLLVIPKGWTLEVVDDQDYRDYLDLDMEMQLHRIPDPGSYERWKAEKQDALSHQKREEEIVSLRARLKNLTEGES